VSVAVEQLPGLDLERFQAWADRDWPGVLAGPVRARLIQGGKSNLTYELSDGSSLWVLRRPPLGHVQATAHDMRREYDVMKALAGTAVPVPAVFAICQDPDVLGEPFYVMEHVHGTCYRSATELKELAPEAVAALAGQMTRVLAELHAIDPAGVGLADFGRAEGFLERQVRRWTRQLAGSRSRELAGVDELRERLESRVAFVEPATPGIVHGDYRLGNLLVADGQVTAVVDWEMATLGDTRTDLGLMLVYEWMASLLDPDAAVAPGYPGPDELVSSYERVLGREVGDLNFHLALAYFKVAVIAEGIHFRHVSGHTVGAGFERAGSVVEPLVDAGLAAVRT
jgi:aminoglycoside phosphotransferase (APT) family kinase protein